MTYGLPLDVMIVNSISYFHDWWRVPGFCLRRFERFWGEGLKLERSGSTRNTWEITGNRWMLGDVGIKCISEPSETDWVPIDFWLLETRRWIPHCEASLGASLDWKDSLWRCRTGGWTHDWAHLGWKKASHEQDVQKIAIVTTFAMGFVWFVCISQIAFGPPTLVNLRYWWAIGRACRRTCGWACGRAIGWGRWGAVSGEECWTHGGSWAWQMREVMTLWEFNTAIEIKSQFLIGKTSIYRVIF